jgi:putative transposase
MIPALLGFSNYKAKEGFLMPTLTTRRRSGNADFSLIADAFLSQAGLPLANVLPVADIERVFQCHGSLFGDTYNSVYSTAIVLWAFLSQVLADGKMRSCSAAVARIADFLLARGETPPSGDTGEYCKARSKLCEHALRDLSVEAAGKIETASPGDWLWHSRHAKLVDGFTATMPDTEENQRDYPQQKSQSPGVGFPILRACVILSLASACVMDATFGPYAGKETGETALLREMLGSLDEVDVLLADRYYCSFMMVALLTQRGVDACIRMYQRRHVDFRRGRRPGKYDHLIEWRRPAKPKWMDEQTYTNISERMTHREFRFQVVGNRRRMETIAELYGHRWSSELDLRCIKQTLNLDHMRCKTPAMVRKELWTTLLAYNLIRRVICVAALEHGMQPRRISFARTCETLLASWPNLPLGRFDAKSVRIL